MARKTPPPPRYSIAEARNHLTVIVHAAEAGQRAELTRRGKPVAAIVSLDELQRAESGSRDFAQALRVFRKAHRVAERGLGRVFEGLRDRSPGREPTF
jgi:prevent-host-death family protein